ELQLGTENGRCRGWIHRLRISQTEIYYSKREILSKPRTHEGDLAAAASRSALAGISAARRECRAGDRCPEKREVRVDVERAPEPRPRRRRSDASFDHCVMEDEQGVSRAEPQCVCRMHSRLLTPSSAVEAPGERIFGVDPRGGGIRHARACQRVVEVPSVIDV